MFLKPFRRIWLLEDGFSLAELLVAAAVGVIVLMAGLQLLVDYTRQDRQLIDLALRREELTRALNFMQMEVRMSNSISSLNMNMPAESGVSLCRNSSSTPRYMPILGLQVRQFVGSELRSYAVIYAVRDLRVSPDNPWTGPYAIYRCGPTFNRDGTYGDYSETPMIVVDGIAAQNTLQCDNDYAKLPNSISNFPNVTASQRPDTGGFATCIHPNRRGVEMQLTGTANEQNLAPITAYAASRSL